MPQTILLVDDTDGVRELCADVLTAAGYQVVSAASVEEANAQIAGLAEPVDVLLSDITMPRFSGADFAHALQSRWPNLRVLLMSGSEPDVPESLPFLPKPFSPSTLLRRVRELLAENENTSA